MANTVKNIGSASIFEKTMAACLESKRTPADAKKKKLAENKKVAKKATSKKINESVRKRKLFEDNELGDELDDPAMMADTDTMDDVVDDIVVVVDPDISADEIDELGSEAQDIIDATPDGEIPMTDEYVDDLTYTCPICGNTFFSDVEMSDGDECPVCGDYPNGYVLVGGVEAPEEAIASEAEDDIEDVADDIEDIGDEIADDAEDIEDELEPAVDEESLKRKPAVKKMEKYSKYSIEESTFNPFLNKFIKENYRNAKSFEIKGARLSGRKLSLECALTFKSGKTKDVTLRVENFKPANKMTLAASEDGTFKSESKRAKVAPFIFEATISKNVIRCESLKYNLITKAVKENARVQISGKLVKESRKPTKRSK